MEDTGTLGYRRQIESLTTQNRSMLIALLMAAPSFQGGHSEVGGRLAEVLETKFPLTMLGLAKVARKHSLVPDKLWPWWKKLRDERNGAALLSGELPSST
jgi:hypothetical protein